MLPNQLADVADSITTTRLVLALFGATDLASFTRGVAAVLPNWRRINFQPSTLVIPAAGYVFDGDGTLYVLGAGDRDYGQLAASVILSDPADVSSPASVAPLQIALLAAAMQSLFLQSGQWDGATRVIFGGHSLGGAAAAIVCAALVDGLHPSIPFSLITTGAPKPGSVQIREALDGVNVVRWQTYQDPVPYMAPNVGIVTFLLFAFPASTLIGIFAGYKQLGGGRLLQEAGNNWVPFNQDSGILNWLQLIHWLSVGVMPADWEAAHSSLHYLNLLQRVQEANSPPVPPAPQPGGSNKVQLLQGDTAMMLVRIYGVGGKQGWSWNFFTNTANYVTALQKGSAVADQLITMMHSDYAIDVISASDPTKTGDSLDQEYGQNGTITGSSFASAPPNVALRFQSKVAFASRRQWWVHGIDNEYHKAGAAWIATGTLLARANAFALSMLNPLTGTGLITTGSGMYIRNLNTAAGNNKGPISNISADTDGRTLITTVANHGIPDAPFPLLQIKGRTAAPGLRGPLIMQGKPALNQVKIDNFFPAGFVYQGGLNLWLRSYTYTQPDLFSLGDVRTHKTGSPFDVSRGRAARKT